MPDTAIDANVCAECEHLKVHHGHYGPEGGDVFGRWSWQDERRCHAWVAPLGRRKTGGRCPCRGWRARLAPDTAPGERP